MSQSAQPSEQAVAHDCVLASVRAPRILIAASGTGGHLIPALHIARAIQSGAPGAVIEFIGAGRPLEEKIVVANGFVRHVVISAGIKRRGPLGVLRFAFRLPVGIFQCIRIMRRFRPDIVVGVGGYVSVLPVVLARVMRIPTWAHEAERHPGLANRVLGYFADRISIAFAETRFRGRANTVHTGHPVRPELASVNRDGIREDAPKRLLILGGSQGARGLDNAVERCGEILAAREVEVVHQCRPENVDLVLNSYRAAKVRASVVSFIDDMAGAYEWSDIIISRSGASSVAEISCVNRPTIFVPYPFQQGTHQSDNAQVLAALNKAVIVEETQAEFGRRLAEALEKMLNRETYLAMKSAPCEPRGLGAAAAIARGIMDLARA
jgi:UDP-N-acetylglucosamine--N-acetylmuramyl-(pentapeptide) pyrophosphoryl-undecaprenol N-acetylglucosamine transferase